MTGLLEGVRVIETGVLMTVDNLGRLLGDERVEVVKVETPQLGDYLRDIGATGPSAEIATHGQMMDDLGGSAPALHLDGRGLVERIPGTPEPERRSGVAVGPLYAAFGVAAALARRGRTGEGAYLDVSCADAVLAFKWLDALPALNSEPVDSTGPGPSGPTASADGVV